MLTYDSAKLKRCIRQLINDSLTPAAFAWLEDRETAILQGDIRQFNGAFASMPRHVGRELVIPAEETSNELSSIRRNFSVNSWSADRLCRVWLLLLLDPADKDKYVRTIEQLFLTAEMNEQVALYSSLPLLAWPELWKKRCAEGIRSNIGVVLESIMCDNPYPAEYLAEPAWNQMVLKAIFTEKPVNRIVGLDERANQDLANTLSDYAHERWAAGRSVNPMLWRCTVRYLNERIFHDIKRIANSDNMRERKAAALVCTESDFLHAKELLTQQAGLRELVASANWQALAAECETQDQHEAKSRE